LPCLWRWPSPRSASAGTSGEGGRADLAAAKIDRSVEQAGYALASAEAKTAVLASYHQYMAAVVHAHRREMNDAKVTVDWVIADLRSGAIRLRDDG